MSKLKPIENGEPYYVRDGAVEEEGCCDCGLVHQMIYKIVGRRIEIRSYRDIFATRLERKAEGIRIRRRAKK